MLLVVKQATFLISEYKKDMCGMYNFRQIVGEKWGQGEKWQDFQ